MNSKSAWCWTGLVAGCLFLLVWEQVESVRLGYEAERLRSQARSQEEKNAYLRLQADRLRSPEWIAQAARSRLAMAPPNPESIVILSQDHESHPAGRSFLARLFRDSTSSGAAAGASMRLSRFSWSQTRQP